MPTSTHACLPLPAAQWSKSLLQKRLDVCLEDCDANLHFLNQKRRRASSRKHAKVEPVVNAKTEPEVASAGSIPTSFVAAVPFFSTLAKSVAVCSISIAIGADIKSSFAASENRDAG